jgi:hypothetical protein
MVICGGSFWFDRKEYIAGWQSRVRDSAAAEARREREKGPIRGSGSSLGRLVMHMHQPPATTYNDE